MALWILEYIELLPLEVEFLWSNKWSIVSALFYILRYWPFVQIPFTMTYFLTILPANACIPYIQAAATGIVFNVGLAQAAMFIRVSAIGGGTRALRIYVTVHYVLSHAGMLAMCVRFYKSMKYVPTPFHDYLGCPAIDADHMALVVIYAIVLFNETTNMALTLFFGYKKYLDLVHTPLLRVLYLDGTMYFVFVAVLSAGNIIINNVVPKEFSYTLIMLQYILHNTVVIRMTLHLRQIATASGMGMDSHWELGTFSELSTLRFWRGSVMVA